MAFFRPWSWLSSSEREAKQEELKRKLEAAQKALDELLEEENDEENWDDDEYPEQGEEMLYDKPYSSLRLMDDTVTVVLHDGTTLTKDDVDVDFYTSVKYAETEDEVLDLFVPAVAQDNSSTGIKVTLETEQERQMMRENLAVLKVHEDFDVRGEEVFLKGVNLAMPATIAATFIEVVEKWMLTTDVQESVGLQEKFNALKMFWMWTALNPIESSRRDLLAFIRNNDIRITKNGLLEMYRRVVSVGTRDKELVNFASNAFYRVSKWGKDASNYRIVEVDGGYMLEHKATEPPKGKVVGNLDEVYNGLPDMKANTFTDAHTRSKSIKVGEIYAEDEEKIDLSNQRDCSNGLHVGSRQFMFSGFGDVGVLALVNPSKVRAVPVYDGHKMRVSEMFIAAVVDLDEYSKSVDENDIVDFSNKYFSMSIEQLSNAVKNRDYSSFNCQGSVVDLNILDIDAIVKTLEAKVVEL